MKKFIIAVYAVIALHTLTLSNSQVGITLDSLIGKSQIVVFGEITEIYNAPVAQSEYDIMDMSAKKEISPPVMKDTAYITVTKVLKNTLPEVKIEIGDRIPLTVVASDSSFHPGYIYLFDHAYHLGIVGFWILEFKNNNFYAFRYDCYQSPQKEKEIREIIEEQNSHP